MALPQSQAATSPPDEQLDRRLQLAVHAARLAGQQTLRWFCQDHLRVERKGDGTPVTAADRGAEELLRTLISQEFPEDAILGEEFGEQAGSSPYRWVLDPIDGTKAFITGVPLYTTLVGVLQDEQPRLGVIHSPATGELIYASPGQGSWYSRGEQAPRRVHVSSVGDLSQATFLTSEVASFVAERTAPADRVYDQLQRRCRVTRTWGDGYGYLLVATGRADVMVDPAMDLWDAAALLPVIQEAGGHFSDWEGRVTVHSKDSLACPPQLVEAVLAITRGECTVA